MKARSPPRLGALVAWEAGDSTSYALFNIQDRGELYIEAGAKVYAGMIVGRNARPGDIDVNVCKKKHVTNSRNSAAAEDALKITGVRVPTLEEAIEFIADDELVEITKSMPHAQARAHVRCAKSRSPQEGVGRGGRRRAGTGGGRRRALPSGTPRQGHCP